MQLFEVERTPMNGRSVRVNWREVSALCRDFGPWTAQAAVCTILALALPHNFGFWAITVPAWVCFSVFLFFFCRRNRKIRQQTEDQIMRLFGKGRTF